MIFVSDLVFFCVFRFPLRLVSFFVVGVIFLSGLSLFCLLCFGFCLVVCACSLVGWFLSFVFLPWFAFFLLVFLLGVFVCPSHLQVVSHGFLIFLFGFRVLIF